MTEPVDRPAPGGRHRPVGDLVPQRKVAAGGLGGAMAVLVLWLIGMSGTEVPVGVEAAITLLVTSGLAYLVPGETE